MSDTNLNTKRVLIFQAPQKATSNRKVLSTAQKIILAFAPLSGGEFSKDQYGVVWKVAPISANNTGYKQEIVYSGRFAAGAVTPGDDSDDSKIVSTNLWERIAPGQKTDLKGSVDEGFDFDPAVKDPSAGSDNNAPMTAWNKTKVTLAMSAGTMSADDKNYQPAIFFPIVRPQQPIKAQINVKLNIYATPQYKENEILKGEVSGVLLGQYNIALLDEPGNTPNVFEFFEDATGTVFCDSNKDATARVAST